MSTALLSFEALGTLLDGEAAPPPKVAPPPRPRVAAFFAARPVAAFLRDVNWANAPPPVAALPPATARPRGARPLGDFLTSMNWRNAAAEPPPTKSAGEALSITRVLSEFVWD